MEIAVTFGSRNTDADILVVQVYFALKYGLRPAGTIAHEWIMAIGAIYGYKDANGRAMDMWEAGELASDFVNLDVSIHGDI